MLFYFSRALWQTAFFKSRRFGCSGGHFVLAAVLPNCCRLVGVESQEDASSQTGEGPTSPTLPANWYKRLHGSTARCTDLPGLAGIGKSGSAQWCVRGSGNDPHESLQQWLWNTELEHHVTDTVEVRFFYFCRVVTSIVSHSGYCTKWGELRGSFHSSWYSNRALMN